MRLTRLPAYVINGLSVALGLALVQVTFSAFAGPHVAHLASTGAIYASLAHLADGRRRTWRKVVAAGLAGCAAALPIIAFRGSPLLVGASLVTVTFLAMMLMAWGPRAGPVTFAAVLAVIFSMATPAHGVSALAIVGWNLAGATTYLAWAVASNAALGATYRTIALGAALRGTASLFRSRVKILESPPPDGDTSFTHWAWLGDEAVLAERLQVARDLLFDAPDTPRSKRETSMLLRTIDLRDILLTSRLDLELIGDDDVARAIRARIAASLRTSADGIDATAEALLAGTRAAPAASAGGPMFDDLQLTPGDARAPLLPALTNRGNVLANEAARIAVLQRGEGELTAFSHHELQRFVAPEGWPLEALRGHGSLESPVLRHAVRASLAVGTAFAIGHLLPWASHPHWLVLSVAVVLRGTLEQTIERRNARIIGTALGCLLVLGLAWVLPVAAQSAIFLAAAGVSHAFVGVRYLVTAASRDRHGAAPVAPRRPGLGVRRLGAPHRHVPRRAPRVGIQLRASVVGAAEFAASGAPRPRGAARVRGTRARTGTRTRTGPATRAPPCARGLRSGGLRLEAQCRRAGVGPAAGARARRVPRRRATRHVAPLRRAADPVGAGVDGRATGVRRGAGRGSPGARRIARSAGEHQHAPPGRRAPPATGNARRRPVVAPAPARRRRRRCAGRRVGTGGARGARGARRTRPNAELSRRARRSSDGRGKPLACESPGVPPSLQHADGPHQRSVAPAFRGRAMFFKLDRYLPLLDPDHFSDLAFYRELAQIGFRQVLLGGTGASNLSALAKEIRAETSLKVVLYPAGPDSVTEHADVVILPDVMNSNSHYARPFGSGSVSTALNIAKRNVPYLPVAYFIMGNSTARWYFDAFSVTQPKLIHAYANYARMLRYPYLALDYEDPEMDSDPEIIKLLLSIPDLPLVISDEFTPTSAAETLGLGVHTVITPSDVLEESSDPLALAAEFHARLLK